MKWTPGHQSEDVEDRRAESGGGGGRMGIPGGAKGLGLGGMLVLLALSVIFKQDFFALLGDQAAVGAGGPVGGGAPAAPYQASAEEQRTFQFVNAVVDDVQGTWAREFQQLGKPYRRAKVVVFRDRWPSGCGEADAGTGPFYCPPDQKVYVDLGFYDELRSRFGAPGDFAQAYVIAHEIGHHVQHLLGIADEVRRAQQARPAQANALSVRLELQADCLAGLWAHSTQQRQLLEAGDVEEGLGAAAAVGDDRLQRMATGRVTPESWTHGSSAQRTQWFRRGFDSGSLSACDTFTR